MIDYEDLCFIRNILSLDNKNIDINLLEKVFQIIKENPNIRDDLLDSFSNNQFKSKLGLLEMIDNMDCLDTTAEIVIFGSWYGSILIPNLASKVKRISCIDLDEKPLKISKNRLFPEYLNIDYIPADVFQKDRERYWNTKLFINTSCEHMHPMNTWPFWENISRPAFFAFQSNNMFDIEGHVNCVKSLDEFKKQMPDYFEVYDECEIEDSRGIRFTLTGKINN